MPSSGTYVVTSSRPVSTSTAPVRTRPVTVPTPPRCLARRAVAVRHADERLAELECDGSAETAPAHAADVSHGVNLAVAGRAPARAVRLRPDVSVLDYEPVAIES